MRVQKIIYLTAIVTLLIAFVSGCHRRPWADDRLSEMVLDHLDDHVKDLSLNESQDTKYQDLRKRMETDLNKTQAEHQAFKLKLKGMIDQENADVKQINSEIRFKLNEMPDKLVVYLDYVDEMWDILDEQQREKVMIEIRERTDDKRWYHHHRNSDKRHGRILERIDNHVDDLNLDENQKVKYSDLRTRLEKELLDKKADHESFRLKMKQLIANENTGAKEITSELRYKLNEMPEEMVVYLDYADEMWDMLNKEQQALVLEEIRDRTDSCLD
ncbi:hypothetical protein KJ966_13815 [bacterium]|nr:hypothetical protein [bacterium]